MSSTVEYTQFKNGVIETHPLPPTYYPQGPQPPLYPELEPQPLTPTTYTAANVPPYYGSTTPHQQPVIMTSPPVQTFVGPIVLSCLTFWLCGWIFGGIAFIIAMIAQSQAGSDPVGARTLGRASIAVSMVGIVIGIATIIVVVVLMSTTPSVMCPYYRAGKCYRYRYSGFECSTSYPGQHMHHDGTYCYFNDI